MAANLKAKISLDTSAFTAGLKIVQSKISSFGQMAKEIFGSAARAGALIGAIFTGISLHHLEKFIKKSLDLESSLNSAGFSTEAIARQFKSLGTGLIAGLSPALSQVFSALESIDFEAVGKKIGDTIEGIINVLYNAFKEGRLLELVGDSIKAGILSGLDYAVKGIRATIEVLQEALGQALAVLFEPSLYAGVQEGLIAAFSKAVAAFIDLLEKPLKAIQDSFTFIFEKIGAASGKIEKPRSFQEIQKQDKFSFGGAGKDDFNGVAQVSFENAKKSFKELMDTGVISIDSIKQTFTKAFSADTIFTPSAKKAIEDFSKITTSLSTPIEKVKTKEPALLKNEANSNLEKIGAIIGGGGASAAVNFARKTADNTATIAKYIIKLTQKPPGTIPIGATFE